MPHEHRDRISIRNGMILKLAERGELDQSQLMGYCGLNNVKHKWTVDEMVEKGLIARTEEPWAGDAFARAGTCPVGTALGTIHLCVGLAGLFGVIYLLRAHR